MPKTRQASQAPVGVSEVQESASAEVPTVAPMSSMPPTQSETQREPVLKPALMRKSLPKLSVAAQQLFDHLKEPPTDEVWEDELDGYQAAFEIFRSRYPTYSKFIDPNKVYYALVTQCGKDELQEAASTVIAANLAILLNALHIGETDREERLSFLEALDQMLPQLLDLETQADAHLDHFDLAFQIRLQYLKELVHSDEEESALRLFVDVFYAPDDETYDRQQLQEIMASTPLRPVSANDPRSQEPWSEKYLEEIHQISLRLSDDDDQLSRANLESVYSYTDFASGLRDWALRRYAIAKGLPPPPPAASVQDLGEDVPASQDETQKSAGIETQLQAQLQAEAEFGRMSPSTPLRVAFHTHEEPTQSPVLFLSQQATPVPHRPTPRVPASSKKRRLPVLSGEADDDEDGAFETDVRVSKKPTKKREKISPIRTDNPASHQSEPSPRAHPRINAPPPPIPEPSLEETDPFKAMSQSSQRIKIQHRPEKPARCRKPWKPEDALLLVEAVTKYGAQWAKIATLVANGQDPDIQFIDRDRDQQALRDKARLMKYHMIINDRLLPDGFDLVALGKKERDTIIQCGRNPNRLVDDVVNVVLEGGVVETRPTNTDCIQGS